MRLIRRATAIALFVLAGALALAPPPAPKAATLVWTATRSLPAGAVLAPRDVTATPATGPPDGTIYAAVAVAGRVLAGPVRRGEILTDVRLVGSDGPDPGPGRVAVPVRPDDTGVVELLAPGVHVAVVGVDAGGDVRALSGDAVVLSVRPGPTGALTGANSQNGALVVLAVPATEADAITAMGLTGSIGLRFT